MLRTRGITGYLTKRSGKPRNSFSIWARTVATAAIVGAIFIPASLLAEKSTSGDAQKKPPHVKESPPPAQPSSQGDSGSSKTIAFPAPKQLAQPANDMAEQDPAAQIDLHECALDDNRLRPFSAAEFKEGMRMGFAFFGYVGSDSAKDMGSKSNRKSDGRPIRILWHYVPSLVIAPPGQAEQYYPLINVLGESGPHLVPGCTSFSDEQLWAPRNFGGAKDFPNMWVQFKAKKSLNLPVKNFDWLSGENVKAKDLKIAELSSFLADNNDYEQAEFTLKAPDLWRLLADYSKASGSEMFPATWFCKVVDLGQGNYCTGARSDRRPPQDVILKLSRLEQDGPTITAVAQSSGELYSTTRELLPKAQAPVAIPDSQPPGTDSASGPDSASQPGGSQDGTAGGRKVEPGTTTEGNDSTQPSQGVSANQPAPPEKDGASNLTELKNQFLAECKKNKPKRGDPYFEQCLAMRKSQNPSAASNEPEPVSGAAEPSSQGNTALVAPTDLGGAGSPAAGEGAAAPEPPAVFDVRFDDALRNTPGAQIAFFSGMDDCQKSFPEVDKTKSADIVSMDNVGKRQEGAASVLVDQTGPLTSCTPATKEDQDGKTVLDYRFKPFEATGPKTVYVVSEAYGFSEENMELPMKAAIAEFVRQAAAPGSGKSLAVLTINGSRQVHTLLAPKDIVGLESVDQDRQETRIRGLLGLIGFSVKSMQPVADTAPLYYALEEDDFQRLVYIVDGRQEGFRPPETGPIYAWLLKKKIPITIVTLGNCSGWVENFGAVGAKLGCVDLARIGSPSGPEIAAAVEKELNRQ